MATPNDTQPTQPTQPSRSQPAPTRPQAAGEQTAPTRSGGRGQPPRPGRLAWLRRPAVVVALCALAALLLVTSASAAFGWSEGRAIMHVTATMQAGMYMLEQYNLAMEDMENGRYDLARQRLEFIYYENPRFLDTGNKLIEVLLVLQNTPEAPTNTTLQPTPTPTEDPRPKEELLRAARQHFAAREWSAVIDTLLALRKADPGYFTADVDGMLFAALRNRGANKIIQQGLFEAGLYDFSLAENFGPLDAQASNYRQWARLYLYGNAFWLAYPQDAAFYYGQLVGMAPDLRDAQGNSAFYRYWQSLVHWAERLATEESWCDASDAYQQALAARNDVSLQPTAEFVYIQCLGPSDTPTPTGTATFTPTITGTLLTPAASATETPAASASATLTPSLTLTPSVTFTPSPTFTETPSPTP
ncbi:MAG: hypothetical protein KIS88_07225 [Anaerolineales bacterium]|nr:hypothetical protein [Anaerolineales bacterium]